MTNAALLGTFGDVGGGPLMFRNKLINGDIKIDQRANGGSAVANTTGSNYIADRFVFDGASSSKFTGQRSAIAPVGFATSMSFTSSAATTVGSTDYYRLMQHIEGQNIADLAWGTAYAKTVTLSFYVYASAAGTYSGAVRNGSSNRSYPFTYSVSAVNTWEYKTIVIQGDTTGTWATDNTLGMSIILSLGCGSTRVGAAGSWSANNYMGATGETQVVATNGANIRFCGLQLEAGSVATPFEQRPIGIEFALCQRYYETGNVIISNNAAHVYLNQWYRVTKRTASTVINVSSGGATWLSTADGFYNSSTSSQIATATYTASAEL